MSSLFKYEIVILDPSLHRYIEATEETENFIQAAYNVLMKDKKLCGKNLKFYCRKPKSGDLSNTWQGTMEQVHEVPGGKLTAISSSLQTGSSITLRMNVLNCFSHSDHT